MPLNAFTSIQLLLLLLLAFNLKRSVVAGGNISAQKTNVQNAPPQQQQPQPPQQPQQPPQALHTHVHQVPHPHPHVHQGPPHVPANLIQNAQYVHDKEPNMQDVLKNAPSSEEDFSDPYQFMNEYKHEARLPSWNPFTANNQQTMAAPPPVMPSNMPLPAFPFDGGFTALPAAKFMPFIGYAQPVFIPYPFYITPEMMYGGFSGNVNSILEEATSRAANGRRPAGSYARNSPIYYMRMPPMPYMLLPGLGYPASNPFAPTMTHMPSYSAMPSFPSFSSIYNVPMSFVANGKPTSIYQMGGAPTDIQSTLHFAESGGFGTRPPPPPNQYRPSISSVTSGYLAQAGFASPPPPMPSQATHQDSKMTLLKRPFLFNGRPEDIFILPNNFNSLYGEPGYY